MAARKRTAEPTLDEVLQALETLAPLALAEPWDKVGLQVRPAEGPHPGRRILLTLDLTIGVVEEAAKKQADLIISYHPPLFTPLETLDANQPRVRPLLMAIQHRMAVYSPHTALDAAPGGLSDWFAAQAGSGETTPFGHEGSSASVGPGRLLRLATPATLDVLALRLGQAVGAPCVQVAPARGVHPKRTPLGSLACCPGAGASILVNAPAEVLLTGEMKHHDLLACTEAGKSVLLCGHAASERPYLAIYARRIRSVLRGRAEVRLAAQDRGPLLD